MGRMKHILGIHQSRDQIGWFMPLVAIVTLGAVLRLWGINFGLPFTYHVDEPTYVSAALNLGAGRIGRQLNPPVLPNILFIEYATYYVIERIFGNISSAVEFEHLYRVDPSVFFLLGRLTSALMGILNIVIIYLVGQKASNQKTGLLAALFLSLSFLHVRDSHFAVPDVMMTLLVSTSVLLCLLATKDANRKLVYWAAFFCGLTIASKWSAWPVIIPLGYAFILLYTKNYAALPMNRLVYFAAGSAIWLLIGFFLPAFQLVLTPGSYIAYALTELRSGASGGFGVWQIDTAPGYIFYLNTLWVGMGGILLLFGIAGILRRVWTIFTSRNEIGILLLLFPLVYYGLMGATHHYFARYALPLIPFLVLFASEAVVASIAVLESRLIKTGWIVFSILVIAASAQPILNSVRFDFLMTQVDTRTIAKIWIEENIPAGSKIAMDWPIHVPPLSADKYDITIIGKTGLADRSIEYYYRERFEYLIASSYIYDIPLVTKELDENHKTFYKLLASEAKLIKDFNPASEPDKVPFDFDEIYGPFVSLWQRERPGPSLQIYELVGSGN